VLFCGLKLTHDGAVALVKDGRLLFSIEMEKLANNPRYSPVSDFSQVVDALAAEGWSPADIDEWVIDGWGGEKNGQVVLRNYGESVQLAVAPYRESEMFPDLLRPCRRGMFPLGDQQYPYTSFLHVSGHLASAYCTSPFAERSEPAIVLAWDGGMFPRLYTVQPQRPVENGGDLFPLIGHTYATAAQHFGPFPRYDDPEVPDELSVAGKLMAYIALGEPREDILQALKEEYQRHFEANSAEVIWYRREVPGFGSHDEPSMRYLHAFFEAVASRLDRGQTRDEDVLASIHHFLGELLLERITTKLRSWKGDGPWNLCLAGGCALNIKWNSLLRAHPMFADVWVPPFPNDSGSAIGCAALGWMQAQETRSLRWHVRRGPALVKTEPLAPDSWTAQACSPQGLAALLHDTGDPVVVLHGRAELGPRALGSRSILAAAVDSNMKERLNQVKGRAGYRPIAPICLVEQAAAIFDPGVPDPYMLFDHVVREDWVDRIPAVLHLDGTARLQTVAREDNPTLAAILDEYFRLSGVPVLCNTSANLNGSGFFPDVKSAMTWGRLDLIWSDGTLYRRPPGTGAQS
jgi:carbamoyltransferase